MSALVSSRWVAYSHVDYSGNQYVLEKGFYNNCADWGSEDNRICSIQPILPVHTRTHYYLRMLLKVTQWARGPGALWCVCGDEISLCAGFFILSYNTLLTELSVFQALTDSQAFRREVSRSHDIKSYKM